MKYLLTVDVPDEMGDKIRAFYVDVWNGFETKEIQMDRKLIPMPLRVASEQKWYAEDKVYMVSHEFTEWDKGWNACVDYLEGEDNE